MIAVIGYKKLYDLYTEGKEKVTLLEKVVVKLLLDIIYMDFQIIPELRRHDIDMR